MANRYVVVTSVKTIKHRYAIPEDDLRGLFPDSYLNDEQLNEFATLLLDFDEAKNLIEKPNVSEMIIDSDIKDESEVLTLYDKDNPNHSFNRNEKISWINSWKKDTTSLT